MKSNSSRPAAETRQPVEHPRRSKRSAAEGAQLHANWRMPSGLGLAEFALKGGFVAPGLMKRSAPAAGER